MRFARAAVLTPLLLLASCGGGGSGTSGSAAAPSSGSGGGAATGGTTTAGGAAGGGSTTSGGTATGGAVGAAFSRPPKGDVRVDGIVYDRSSILDPAYGLTQDQTGTVQRFEVHAGDRGYSGDEAKGKERYELVTKRSDAQKSRYFYGIGTDIWLSYSFMIEEGGPMVAPYTIVGQFHPNPVADGVSLSPTLAFVASPADADHYIYALVTHSATTIDADVKAAATTRWKITMRRGEWINIVVRLRTDPLGTGELQFWADGVEQLDLGGLSIGYISPGDVAYWQYGIYRTADPNALAARYANVEQGTQSLLNRVTSPRIIPADAQ